MDRALPFPAPGDAWSVFLDFDGTLTEIVATPGRVRVDPALPATLMELSAALGGAVALVSGRRIDELDRFLAPARLPSVGLHGLERRGRDGRIERFHDGSGRLDPVRAAFGAAVGRDPRLLLEDKGIAVALHYRAAPGREPECRALAREAVAGLEGYHVLQGKMVVEVKPAAGSKGAAIERFMAEPDFSGRRPLFAGDDVTDEDGFDAVNRLGGISIKVGPGLTRAAHRISSVASLLAWLHALAGRIAPAAGRGG